MLDPYSQTFQQLTPFQQLVEVMKALRAPDGCPWDREQDHHSLTRFLQEEACEVLDAIERGQDGALCEELGDLLLQIVFHSQIASEEHRFSVDDVCRGVVNKMVRRHPHVFAAEKLATAKAVKQRWEALKKAEKKERTSLMDGLPRQMSAVLTASRIQGRAAEVGFEWPDTQSALAKVKEELAELEEALAQGHHQAEELGDLLFAVTSLARAAQVEPEAALRATCSKFTRRFRALEKRLGDRLGQVERSELGAVWEQVQSE